jgi:hypothetical protein
MYNILIDEYFLKNKIKVIYNLYIQSCVNILVSGFLNYLFRKYVQKIYFYPLQTNMDIIHAIIVAPIIEEIIYRFPICLMKVIEKYEKYENRIIIKNLLMLFAFTYSHLIFPYRHINNFNSNEMNNTIAFLYTIIGYNIPAIHFSYLNYKYSLTRSIILHTFINMNVLLLNMLIKKYY